MTERGAGTGLRGKPAVGPLNGQLHGRLGDALSNHHAIFLRDEPKESLPGSRVAELQIPKDFLPDGNLS